MDIRSYKGGMCYMVWENAILALGCQGDWIKNNRDLGGKQGVEAQVQKMVARHPLSQQGGRR